MTKISRISFEISRYSSIFQEASAQTSYVYRLWTICDFGCGALVRTLQRIIIISMASATAVEVDRYTLVSSFYGPGAVGGWYLTALACLISFGLHPRKRRADSITVDMIAVLTFPTVAAAHLVSQIRSCPTEMSSTTLTQKAASMEAALIVIEVYLIIAVVLLMLAVGFRRVKQGCLFAAVSVFCFSVECHLYFSRSVTQAIERSLDRSFQVNFGRILIDVMTLVLCIVFAFFFNILFFISIRPSRSRSHARTVDHGSAANAQVRLEGLNQDIMDSRDARGSKWFIVLFSSFSVLFSSFLVAASIISPIEGVIENLPPEPLLRLRAAVSHVAQALIPASNTSVKKLDQAVAILAGASVLGFSIYDVANAYYKN